MDEDLTGQRFGSLTVLRRDTERSAARFQRCWLCRCDCGNLTIVETYKLKRQFKTSCGCDRGRPVAMETVKFRQEHGCEYCAERKECPKEYCKYENQLKGKRQWKEFDAR